MARRVNLADMLEGEPMEEPTEGPPRQADIYLTLADIADNPENPRGVIDHDAEDFEELVVSINDAGVITPITVCNAMSFLKHHPEHTETIGRCRYVLLAGHRRAAAARAAGLASVPAVVNDNGAKDPLVWAVAENMQRVDLNPMQQAHTLGVLTSAPPKGRGLSQGKVAAGIGKTQAFVSQRVALLKLVPKLQELVATGQLGVREARTFARLPQQEQLAAYERPTPAEPAELQPAATPATPLQPANTEPDPREAGGVGGGKAGAADGSYNPVMGRAGTESFEDEASPSPDEQPADVPEVEPSEGDNQPGVAQHGQPQAVEAAPAAGNSTIPTQQSDSPQEGTTPLSAVDWHDAQAFAEAIRSELSAQEIRALTEQLTASLRVAGASES